MSIIYTKEDKSLLSLSANLNKLKIVKEIQDKRSLYLYGIGSAKEIDIALPNSFPGHRKLLNYFEKNGLSCRIGCYWSSAIVYNNKVMGIGHTLRSGNKDLSMRCIIAAYLALNDYLDDNKDKINNFETDGAIAAEF